MRKYKVTLDSDYCGTKEEFIVYADDEDAVCRELDLYAYRLDMDLNDSDEVFVEIEELAN